MISRHPDPLVARLRPWTARICPPAIQERVADQALADLAQERADLVPGARRALVTIHGVTRLLLPLLLSLLLLRRHWRDAPWWPAPVFTRDTLGWVTLLTLLLILRAGLARPEYRLLPALLPDFVLMHVLPLALPAAVLGLALMQRSHRATSTALLAISAAALSLLLTLGGPTLMGYFIDHEVRTDTARPILLTDALPREQAVPAVREAAWAHLVEVRRQQWRHHTMQNGVAKAAFCILLPFAAALVAARFRLRVGIVPALAVALIALELVFRWTSTIPPPGAASAGTLLPMWLPHFVLAAFIVGLSGSWITGRGAQS